nr:MAG TPA: hypothetical protein [Microviridae sp.]
MLKWFVTWIIPECLIDMKKKEYLQHEFNGSFDVAHTKVPVQDALAQLATVKNKDGSLTVSTDITLIFNQQRLENKLTTNELREYIQRYTPNKSVYTAQLDDDTLLSTLKSRHIQSLSEMRSWAEYCMENYDSLIKEAEEKARLAAESVAAESAAGSTAANSSVSATSE